MLRHYAVAEGLPHPERRINADVNAEAKRRVVTERKAGKYDGNAGKR